MKKLGLVLLAVASVFLMVSVALADVAVSVDNTRKGNATRLDFPAGTTATRDPQDLSIHLGLAKTVVNGVRDSNTEGYEYFSTITGNITGINTDGSNSAKTYGLYINMTRALGADTLTGDLDDAGIKVRMYNSATTNTAGNTLRGIDVDVSNTQYGVISNISGGIISSQVKTAATAQGSVTNQRGLEVNCTDNGYVTALLIPLDVRLFRQGAVVPTTECVARLRNGNTTGSGATGLRFESESAGSTSAYFTNVIDMSAATVSSTGAQIRFTNGACVFAGALTTRDTVRAAAGTCSIGSIYLSSAGKVYFKAANNGSTADWVLVSHTDAD